MRLYKALFVLPTLFTLTSVFLGLLSIVSAADGNFRLGALAIIFAILFDSIDGRVARMTRTQSKFGVQIDSLADVVSFGVAPAALVYMALLRDRYVVGVVDFGLVAAFVYLACGAMRLARYNVDAERKPGPVKSFTGLPIPGGAGLLAGMVFGLVKEGRTISGPLAIMLLVLLALLMVSTVKYRKKLDMHAPDTFVLLGLLAFTLLLVGTLRPAFLVFSFFAFYVAAGLVEGTVRGLGAYASRSRARRHLRADEQRDHDLSGR